MMKILFFIILGLARAQESEIPPEAAVKEAEDTAKQAESKTVEAAEAAAQEPAKAEKPAIVPTAKLANPAPSPVPSTPAPKPARKGPARPEDISSQTQEMSSLVEEESLVTQLTKPFVYEKEGKRDPFSAPEAKPDPLNPGPLFGPLMEGQDVDLSKVVLKGIYLNPTSPKALIAYPGADGTKQILRKISVGDYLGENYGVVSAIRDGRVIIVQTLDEGDKKSTTTRTLTIGK